ncbi:hypothetical protein SADUNF_Sadunf03G0169200 [Salix dunnii]|uniref:Endonuclease/exonuclease/phosphatase domain-containing protein n=1 Tax=Salix dunnii TaxID=1413687 RepID=A0A835N5A4_9ROSI|nr:hypothetical protein SADUNF_Sadunf03G0169200 [Salix dunnii]
MVLTKSGTNTGSNGKAPTMAIEENAHALNPTGKESACNQDKQLKDKEDQPREKHKEQGTMSNDTANEDRNPKLTKKAQASKGVTNHIMANHSTANETTHCSVNKVASLHSHTTEEETDSSVDSLMRANSHENRDISPLAFTKVISLLETKVIKDNMSAVEHGLNLMHGISSLMQLVSCKINFKQNNKCIIVSFAYGLHTPADRASLWADILRLSWVYQNQAWLLMGDFNATLKASDSMGGDDNWIGHKMDFGNCLTQAQLTPLPYKGNAYATFLPRSTDQEDFLPIVSAAWQSQVRGSAVFQLTTKLKIVKAYLTNWHKHHRSDISRRVVHVKAKWEDTQKQLDIEPLSEEARQKE